ncbi:GerMN domain-containing protein [Nocardioides sp. KIGAM211]|uniref:GerMN domain-containing protein n=1 Tax=Nocardioides luti TaxID=2761101 RepID=A0A7X0RKZ4_9ACTN|nr:LpqB family beta-propeller domain-containing protein [Nocardioides luti]MBB6629014.1 GerMN domain-containing protein [Nocardioides luti]
MSRRLLVAAMVCLGLLLPAGCVRMPDSGPIVQTGSGGSLAQERPFDIEPKPPQPGDSPAAVVKGFLDAMTASPIDATVARQFLTGDAAAAWTPELETITYADASNPRGSDPRVSVTLSGADRLDSRGTWLGPLPRDQRVLQFPVARDDNGEWRLTEVPNALIVPETWFELRFRQVSLYFFDPTAEILVPEPVFVPRGDQLASTLTAALLRGPRPELTQASRTFIPPGLKLDLSAPVSADGVADISLTGDAGQLTPQTTELILAQFAWTLRQEPTIRSLRVSIGDQQLQLPGAVSTISVNEGSQYDPVGFQASPLLYGLQGGLLVAGARSAFEPVDGPFGDTAYGVSRVRVSVTGAEVAGISGGGRSVLRGPVRGGSADVREVVSDATDLLPPAWDLGDRLWLLDRTKSGARILTVTGDGDPQPLRVQGISGRDVRSFLVSRDGSRLVAAVRPAGGGGDQILVSRIVRDDRGRVRSATAAQRIGTEVGERLNIRDLAWSSPTSVAVLDTINDALAQVRTVSVDGSPPGIDSLSTTLRGRILGLVGSPVPGESLYAVARTNLVDLSSADRGDVALDSGVTSLGYVG